MTDVSRSAIAEAHARIRHHIRRTPVVATAIEGLTEPVTLKLEMLQHSGSFKARGAFNNLLIADVPGAGITAASGGNHGVAVAYAASTLGIPAHIFVPSISAPAKVEKIRSHGADVTVEGEHYAAALRLCEDYAARTGAISFHAYDAVPTLCGQGTLAREFESQVPGLDTVLIAVGGGGLIGGMAAWYSGSVRVVAVEPEGCATLHDTLSADERVTINPMGVAADSLGASSIGKLVFPIAKDFISKTILVTDTDIRAAQRWLWNDMQLITEPGGATVLAALLSGAYKPRAGEKVGAVICGANTDPVQFAEAIAL